SALLSSNGPIGELPGGSVRAAVGFEFRRDEFYSFNDLNTGLVYATPTNTELHRTGSTNARKLTSLFMELYVPIFGERNARPGLSVLELGYRRVVSLTTISACRAIPALACATRRRR